jgi:hypothetical protein
MKLPGFNAETSAYRTNKPYYAASAYWQSGLDGKFTPQYSIYWRACARNCVSRSYECTDRCGIGDLNCRGDCLGTMNDCISSCAPLKYIPDPGDVVASR